MKTKLDVIPLMSPLISEEDIAAAAAVLRSGMLIQGKEVQDLEGNVCNYIETEYALALSNGTATLHLALKALGIGPGDEVIVPAFSYVATANVVELVGASCVFVDIDLDTFNINTELVEKAITSRTKAIIPVHEFGLACNITRVMEIAEKHGLHVIEDAACALGATENGKRVGSFGTFGSFSFHPRKAITSGEGGVLTVKNKELANKINILRNHGIEMQNGKMEFVEAGFNYRMTDFQAALINNQIKRLDTQISYKQELALIYFEEIRNKDISLPRIPQGKNHTWQTFHVLLAPHISRDAMIVKLKSFGIGTNYGAQCIPYQKYFFNKYKLDCEGTFPNAMRAYKSGLAIPLYEKLDKEDIARIAEVLNKHIH